MSFLKINGWIINQDRIVEVVFEPPFDGTTDRAKVYYVQNDAKEGMQVARGEVARALWFWYCNSGHAQDVVSEYRRRNPERLRNEAIA